MSACQKQFPLNDSLQLSTTWMTCIHTYIHKNWVFCFLSGYAFAKRSTFFILLPIDRYFANECRKGFVSASTISVFSICAFFFSFNSLSSFRFLFPSNETIERYVNGLSSNITDNSMFQSQSRLFSLNFRRKIFVRVLIVLARVFNWKILKRFSIRYPILLWDAITFSNICRVMQIVSYNWEQFLFVFKSNHGRLEIRW